MRTMSRDNPTPRPTPRPIFDPLLRPPLLLLEESSLRATLELELEVSVAGAGVAASVLDAASPGFVEAGTVGPATVKVEVGTSSTGFAIMCQARRKSYRS